MSISGVSNSSSTQAAWQAMIQQQKQAFSQLSSALQNGDLAGAQQAFASLQNSSGQGQTSNTNATSSTNSSSGNTIANDFRALSTALQSGNVKDAQSAFGKLQADMKAKKGGHHHHHHGGGSNTASTNSTNTSSTTSVAAILENSTMSVSA